MKGIYRIIFVSAITSTIIGFIIYKALNRFNPKIAVVDATKLYTNYNMKVELEQIAKIKLHIQQRELDSMRELLQIKMATNPNDNETKRITFICEQLGNKLENDLIENSKEINLKVWKRLNPMLDEYGKAGHFQLIIGANGTGNVLYSDDFYDRTNDVINYVNDRYAQGN